MANIFVGVPIYDQLTPQSLPGLILATHGQHGYHLQTECGSLLALIFNKLWCAALNKRRECKFTHFAMHHADIEAPPGWLDTLVAEMARINADVLSVVVPIKDQRGVTSTGYQDPTTRVIRRFTMTEVQSFNPTFNNIGARRPYYWLVINTGLWICDFTKPWAEEVCFSVLDAVVKEDDGTFCPKCLPEDWNFSGWCARKGLKVFATTTVPVAHHGRFAWRNDSAWGMWETDKGDKAA